VVVLYVLSVLTVIQAVFSLKDALHAARYLRNSSHPSRQAGNIGRVAVFCPCKGLDPDLERNIRSILDQDFSNYEVYFIVESRTDPAYFLLEKIASRQTLVAGEAVDCGQKVHNLRHAIESVGEDYDTYVFCDSDARYPKYWLSALTAPLSDGTATVTTGYRWYVADRFQFPTLLRSAWNSSALGLLGDHHRNFAWGGSTALSRQTFRRIKVLDAWQGALSDDYAIARAAQAAGTKIHFVPECLIPSYGHCSFSEMLEFTTRQIIITRVYRPRLWQVGLVAQTFFNVTFWCLLLTALVTRSWIPSLLFLTIYGLSAARSALRTSAVKSRLHGILRFPWFYVLATPLVSLLYEYNLIIAGLTRDIEWRQIHYTLISANETRVRRR